MAGYDSWVKEFNDHVEITVKASQRAFQSAGQRLFNLIKEKTPIGDPTLWRWPAHSDYTPGTLYNSWEIINQPYNIKIYNDTPYGERVEYGSWSTQAPQGMMRISILEFGNLLNETTKENKV